MNLNQTFAELAHNDHVQLDPSWAQGRAHFGGLTAGLMLAKLQHFIGQPRRLRSATINFVGPMDCSKSVELQCQILRVGQSVLQGQVHLWQDGAVQAVLLAAFGQARPSAAICAAHYPAPTYPPVEQLPPLPDNLPYLPRFLQHIDLRWAEGALPFSGAKQANFGGYLRFKDQQGACSVPHLLTLADGFPPALTTLTAAPAPASSLTWTFELLNEIENIDCSDFWTYRVITDQAAEGYGHSEAKMWDKTGRLLVISRQTCTVFDKVEA